MSENEWYACWVKIIKTRKIDTIVGVQEEEEEESEDPIRSTWSSNFDGVWDCIFLNIFLRFLPIRNLNYNHDIVEMNSKATPLHLGQTFLNLQCLQRIFDLLFHKRNKVEMTCYGKSRFSSNTLILLMPMNTLDMWNGDTHRQLGIATLKKWISVLMKEG
jgi:hypothetical protein